MRARYLVDRAGPSSTRAARLEERVSLLEEAAASVEMPSLWYFLESARLIRAGDLAEAKTAFDAGLAEQVVDERVVPPALDLRVSVDTCVPPQIANDGRATVPLLVADHDAGVRTRHVAGTARRRPTRSDRLEARLDRFEVAATSVKAPFRWYFLASASLIRTVLPPRSRDGRGTGIDSPTGGVHRGHEDAPAAVEPRSPQ